MTQPWQTDWAMLYRDPRQRHFLVVAEAKRGFAKSEIGQPVVLNDPEFDLRVTETLTQFLDSFQSNVYEPERARGGSPEENSTFIKNHLAVSVERLDSGDLILRPYHHKSGGYVAVAGEHIAVQRDQLSQRLAVAIREAFDLAT